MLYDIFFSNIVSKEYDKEVEMSKDDIKDFLKTFGPIKYNELLIGMLFNSFIALATLIKSTINNVLPIESFIYTISAILDPNDKEAIALLGGIEEIDFIEESKTSSKSYDELDEVDKVHFLWRNDADNEYNNVKKIRTFCIYVSNENDEYDYSDYENLFDLSVKDIIDTAIYKKLESLMKEKED